MKKLFFPFLLFCIFTACENTEKEEDIHNETETPGISTPEVKQKNENILVETLIYTGLHPISNITSASYDKLRSMVIDNLSNQLSHNQSFWQDMSDDDLSWNTLLIHFLAASGVKSASQLKTMTIEDCKSALIAENVANTSHSTHTYETKSVSENLNTAYEWWFQKNPTSKSVIDKLNNISDNNPTFDLKDDRGKGMDVLRIVKADEEDYVYLGVYHYMVGDGHFKLCLSGSNDLKQWTYIADIGDRAHQGDIVKWNNGYIVANEEDKASGSNNIQVRYFSSYEDLKKNNPTYDKSIQRTFAPSAEGTPDIRKIEGNTAETSYLLIGFHYYENSIKDQLAFGILKNFNEWKSWKNVIANGNIKKMGYQGNIGGRKHFHYSDTDYVIQEAQIIPHDWGAWRILLGNGMFYYNLQPLTPLNSISFANPSISLIEENKFAVTYYMHGAGNALDERGELIYLVNFNSQ